MNEEMNNGYENQHVSYNNFMNEGGAAQNPSFEYQTQQTPQNCKTPEKHKKGGVAVKIVALALCCAMVGGVCGGFVGAKLAPKSSGSSGTSTVFQGTRGNTVLDVKNIDTSKELSAAEVYAQNVNSTVRITTSITSANFWGQQTMGAVSGSGFIISDDGYIVTNYHVIEDAASIKVTTYSGESYSATVIGYDESNDVAVLKIEAEGLSPVVIGDSDNMNVGDSVVAIGNPLGELTFSLTAGAVSALDREITLSSGVTMDLIQTDCAINSGNSGGALFNMYGEVIGITNAKYSSSSSSEASIDNIGFAIPMNRVYGIIKSIIENGYIAKPYIGVSVGDVSEETQGYGLPKGAAVKSITEGSPAEKAGLQVNDIITKAGDREITSSGDLVDVVSEASSGDVLKLTVYRSGSTIEIDVTVGENIQSALANEQQTEQNQQSQQGGRYYSYGYGIPGFGGFGG